MVVPMLLRFACSRVVRKLESYGFRRSCPKLHPVDRHSLSPTVAAGGGSSHGRDDGQALVCDFEGALLSTTCTFPYFMLVAFEGGGLLRALLLLLLWPLLWLMSRVRRESMMMRAMTFVTFCGLSAEAVDLVRRAVLPKFYLENLRLQPCELLAACTGRRVVVTAMPRPMVEGFLREYLGVSEVVAPELQVEEERRCFTGFLSVFSRQKALEELFRERKADVAVLSPSNCHDHLLATYSKEIYVVNEEEAATALPRGRYTKPLVFHDGRLAFFPTPCATLAFFLWLPIAVPLAVSRILIGTVLPYELLFLLAAFTGFRFRLGGQLPAARKGVLFACNHRTLLDPVMLSAALRRHRAGGGGDPGGDAARHHGQWEEVVGSGLIPNGPSAGVQGTRADAHAPRRREELCRGGERGAEAHSRGAGVRVHWAHAAGEVPVARRKRRGDGRR